MDRIQPASTLPEAIPLSDEGERVLRQLTILGCDPTVLRAVIHTARFFARLDLCNIDSLLLKIVRLDEGLDAFRKTADFLYLFPPLGQPTVFGAVAENLKVLRGVLERWKVRRQRKFRRPHYWQAMVCAQVYSQTGHFHDEEVATLWDEVVGVPGSNTGQAVSQFRQRHHDLVQDSINAVAKVSTSGRSPIDHSSPPPGPPTS
jgi:hypothetical protein